MQDYQPAKLLRLHFTEEDRYQGKPLYEAVVQKCMELRIAGATVFRGVEGFGDTAEVHRSRLRAHDLPIVIEIVDTEAKIAGLIPIVEEMLDKGLIAASAAVVRRVEKTGVEKTGVEKQD